MVTIETTATAKPQRLPARMSPTSKGARIDQLRKITPRRGGLKLCDVGEREGELVGRQEGYQGNRILNHGRTTIDQRVRDLGASHMTALIARFGTSRNPCTDSRPALVLAFLRIRWPCSIPVVA